MRLAEHEIVQWLERPNPATTRYRLFDDTMQDLGIYWSAYWLKVPRRDGSIGLVRLPPGSVSVEGWLLPAAFIWTLPDGARAAARARAGRRLQRATTRAIR